MKRIRFWAYFSAFLSLVISLAIVGYWICSVHELKVVNLNTFVGVTVALLGLIVTLAIAWQIYNAVDMKNKVEELKQLEDRLKEQEKSLEQFKLQTTRDLCAVASVSFPIDDDNSIQFFYSLVALEAEMKLEKQTQLFEILEFLELLSKEDDMKSAKKADDIMEQDKDIRALSNYELIKGRYEPIYNEYISKIEKVVKQQ